ncbi:MAG: hypothetical protein K2Q01_11005, partial [Rickettsiales bacterium]|nr:hypothetical protein [Rickettsiales bacterium]
MQAHQLLEWYLEAGVDEAVADAATDYFALATVKAAPPAPSMVETPAAPVTASGPVASPLHHTPSAAMAMARELADKAQSMAELEAMVR